MAETMARTVNRPAWVDLGSEDAAASRDFYSKLFGWEIEVNEDPQYGGYGIAKVDGRDAAGIGPKQDPNAPTVWSLYIGTDDIDALAQKVTDNGGTVVVPPFPVGDQGRMAVFRDPAGAFISSWEGERMGGFQSEGTGSFAWAEINARGVDQALPFYTALFGWSVRTSPMGEGQPPYNEFQIGEESVAGAWEMSPDVPAEVPSYWQVYFGVDDVDAAFRKALDLGAREMNAPMDFPGGRFAIVVDPQGASFGLLRTAR